MVERLHLGKVYFNLEHDAVEAWLPEHAFNVTRFHSQLNLIIKSHIFSIQYMEQLVVYISGPLKGTI